MDKQMLVPVFTASLVSSKEPSKHELPNNEDAIEKQKTPKNFEICYGKPIVESTYTTKQTLPNINKSRSFSVIRFKSSYIRCLRSFISNSPDAKYSKLSYRSLCSALKTSYTVAGSKSISSETVGSYSYRYSTTSRSTSYSGSPCSKSPRSTSPASFKSTCSRSKYHHSRSPLPKRTRRFPSKLLTSKRSCLKHPALTSRKSNSPISTSSCSRTVASRSHYSRSSPPRSSCLKQSLPNHPCLRAPVPRKSCLRSPTLKSPDIKSPQSKPPCIKYPSFSHSKQSACKASCLRSPIVSFSKPTSSNCKFQGSRLSRFESNQLKIRTPASKTFTPSYSNKFLRCKSPCLKSIILKSACTRNSRSPETTSAPSKSTASSKTPSFKTADASSVQSNSPQSYSPRSKSPCGRFVNAIRGRFHNPPPKATLPTLDVSGFPLPKSPNSRVTTVTENNRGYFKPEAKRCPKLTVSKIFVRSRFSQGSRRPHLKVHDGNQIVARSQLRFYDYRHTDSKLKYRLSRHLIKNLNREILEKSLNTKMDVRYITEWKNYFQKIRGAMACDAPKCPALQERFRTHRMNYHGGRSHANMQAENKVAVGEAQTKITLANIGGLTISLETRPTSTDFINKDMDNGPYEPSVPMQSSMEALVELYRKDLEREFRQWLKKIPTREDTPEDEQRKNTVMQNFVDRIIAMDLTKRDPETKFKLRKEIDEFLGYLNLWYPGSNSDREAFKEGLRENLIDSLFHQSDKFLDSVRNLEDNIRNENGPQGYQNNKSNGNQDYGYNGSQPFGGYGSQIYGKNGTQGYANNVVSSNYQSNSIHPYLGPYNRTQSFGSQRSQNNRIDGTQTYANDGVPLNFQPNSAQPYGNLYIGSNTNTGSPSNRNSRVRNYANSSTPYGNNVPQNTDQNLYTDSNTKPSNKGNVNLVIDKFGNLVSYGQFGTPSYRFSRNTLPNSVPDGMQNQSNMSYNILDPTQSRVNQNTGMNRNDDLSTLSSRNPSKNQNQVVSKPGIRIADHPNYEGGYTPVNVGQPRRPSLKSASNSNTKYETADKELTSRLTSIPGLKPHNIEPKNLRALNYPNVQDATIVSKQQEAMDNGPLRNTTYDLSFGNYPDRNLLSSEMSHFNEETCKNYSRNKLNPISYSEPNLKCTVRSNDLCICPSPDKKIKKQTACCGLREIDLETEIGNWLKKCSFVRYDGLMNKEEIIDALILQVTPYLSQPSYSLNKAVLKAKIMHVLRGLGICASTNSARRNMLYRLASELANRLIGIASRLECSGASSWKCNLRKNRPFRYIEQVHVGPNEVNREDLKHDLLQEFEYCVNGTKLENNRQVLELISEIIIDRIELIRRNADEIVRMDIKKILMDTNILSEEEVTNIVNNIFKYTREIVIMIASKNNRTDTTITARPCISILSIYTSEHEVTPNFAAAAGSSTPKKKKEVSKLSPEENTYTNKITSAVRDWLKTVPEYFKNLEDKNMKEVMILDLAGSIADHAKLGQLITSQKMDTQQFMTYYICKWLLKFEIIDELSRAEPYIQTLVAKLQEIEVPIMTRPQYGTRQVLKNIQYQETEEAWTDSYIPKAQDILEDEISIWMNEYPSEIYVNKDKSTQNKLVHEFAEDLQKYKKDDDANISVEIKTWLQKVVKAKDKEMIDSMSKSLRNRIFNLPQDKTIAAKAKQRADNRRMLNEADLTVKNPQIVNEEDSDKTMKEFIIKYVEYNFDEDDPLAKRAYAKLLRHELQRLNSTVLKQVYEGQPQEKFSPHKLYRELGYIKDISDWLKTLPIDPNYNKIGNPERVEFCIYLAREICNVDEERHQKAMNYDEYIASILCQFIGQLPLKLESTDITEYVHSLLLRVFRRRNEVPPISPNQLWANIADFLDDYINLNGQDIAHDEVKLEAWAARLLQEIKKMIVENPSSLPVTDVNDRLAHVTKPGDETIKRFNHELDYAKEISDWLKNLPLTYTVNEELIRDLAEKMAEYENKVDDSELVQYIQQWISQLPLNKSKQIDLPFVIQQLLNRRKKVNEDKTNRSLPFDEGIKQKSTGTSLNTGNSGAKTDCRGCCPVDDPGSVIIEVIKEWCKNIPFEGEEEDVKCEKNNIESKIYQKIIEINDNPRMARNDLLYMESISSNVDELLKNIPNNLKLGRDKNQIKTELLDKVKLAKMFYRDVTLGDEYMKDLEDAIEAVLPDPSPMAKRNPGFEAYKENLAELFILENFDHGNDADKLKYEQIMKKEINKFSPSLQQRTVIPIEEEKLNNDIISTLFDVNMPEEKAMVDNVEEIKTKCEIQNWFDKLPLQPVSGQAELLERDLKVSLLARKLHILEFEKDSEQKIHKEITKWLAKLPLLPGEGVKIDAFADDLQEILKTTSKSRKCVKASDVDIGKSGILNGSSTDQDTQNSIWTNPYPVTESGNNTQKPLRLKSGDILINIVEQWSDNIPLPPLPNDQLQIVKGDLRTRLYKKISELNSTKTFDDEQMYNILMGQEIVQALTALPQSDALVKCLCALQYQLLSAIASIKPLIREERELYEYKKRLENIVCSTLGRPVNPTTEEKLLFSKIQEEVVNDFIEYKYNKNDDEGQQFYKNKLLDALTEYNSIGEKEENRNEIVSDTLVETNKLICELDKIPAPDEPALKEEVEEIRMKREVDNFLNNVAPADQVPNKIHRNSLRNSLAKQLHNLEKTGHSEINDQKMEAAVNRTLKKLSAESKTDEIKTFLEKLKKNEVIRKAPGYKESPSKALKSLMKDQFPPQDSVSLDPQGMQIQVNASVYRPDYIPPNWKPTTPPPPSDMYPDLLVVLPRQSLPPSPGPIGSGLMPSNVRHTITQPTQTPTHTSGLTQTSGLPPGAQRMGMQTRLASPGKFLPLYDSRYVPGQYGPPSQLDPRMVPGHGQFHPRMVPDHGQFNPRLTPGQGQFHPSLIPGQSHFVPPQASNARVDSEVELLGHECLCDFCNKRCPYFDCESFDDFPMMCRHSMMPMCPIMPPMPMPCPSMMMPPPAYMFC